MNFETAIGDHFKGLGVQFSHSMFAQGAQGTEYNLQNTTTQKQANNNKIPLQKSGIGKDFDSMENNPKTDKWDSMKL